MAIDRRYTPTSDAPLGRLIDLLDSNRLGGAVLVQPSFLGTDNSFLLSALAETRRPGKMQRFWGVVAVAPDTPAQRLDAMKEAGIIGVRLNLFGAPLPEFGLPVWSKFFNHLNRLGWHVEIHLEGPRLPAALPVFFDHCERIVVDHFGLPDPERPQYCRGLRALLEARTGQLWVKASAPYRVFDGQDPVSAAVRCRSIYRLLEEALGSKRVLWGSDWPWTQFASVSSYETTLRWLEDWRRPAASAVAVSERP